MPIRVVDSIHKLGDIGTDGGGNGMSAGLLLPSGAGEWIDIAATQPAGPCRPEERHGREGRWANKVTTCGGREVKVD